jgi:hypothetical protein
LLVRIGSHVREGLLPLESRALSRPQFHLARKSASDMPLRLA